MQFKICKIERLTVLKTSFRNFTVTVSKGQVEGFIFITNSVSVVGVFELKVLRETAQGACWIVYLLCHSNPHVRRLYRKRGVQDYIQDFHT